MQRTLQDDLGSYFTEDEQRSIEIGLSEKFARSRHPNFDEIIAPVFGEMGGDPELRRKLLSQADIAESCYRYGTEGTEASDS